MYMNEQARIWALTIYSLSCASCFALTDYILAFASITVSLYLDLSLSFNSKPKPPSLSCLRSKMKSSLSSSSSRKLLVTLALAVFLVHLCLPTSAATRLVSNTTGAVPRNSGQQNHHRHRCDLISRSTHRLRSLCIQLHKTQPLPPPSPPSDHEIDPRYGVEKRLVPSGPNPLHN